MELIFFNSLLIGHFLNICFLFLLHLKSNSRAEHSTRDKNKHPPLLPDTSVWHWCSVSHTNSFVTCLSSSSKHKDYCFYCFWFCAEYFGHFSPVIHIYENMRMSIQQCEGRVIFFSSNCTHFPSEWTNVWLCKTQRTNHPLIVPTQTDSWCSHI